MEEYHVYVAQDGNRRKNAFVLRICGSETIVL